jgi:hypothetical protein
MYERAAGALVCVTTVQTSEPGVETSQILSVPSSAPAAVEPPKLISHVLLFKVIQAVPVRFLTEGVPPVGANIFHRA